MRFTQRLGVLTVITVLGVSLFAGNLPTAQAQDPDVQKLLEQVQQLQKEVTDLKGGKHDSWIQKRQAEEFKSLVRDVLDDADSRMSMQGGEAMAGHDGKNFFLGSADGTFKMAITGQEQFRYIWNHHEDRGDEDIGGFQLRRAKVGLKGHVTANPKIKYKVVLATSRGSGNVFLEDAIMSIPIEGLIETEGTKVTVHAGLMKIPYLYHELSSSSKMMAVERPNTVEYFTHNRAEQIQLDIAAEQWQLIFAIHDGANSSNSDFHVDAVEIGLAARFAYAVMGAVKDASDPVAWSGKGDSLVISGAVTYETGDGQTGPQLFDQFAWTIDAVLKLDSGVSVIAAIMGATVEFDTPSTSDIDPFGYVVEAGMFVVPDKVQVFARFDGVDDDSAGPPGSGPGDWAHFLTFGFNYFLNKHNAKFTADVVITLDGDQASTVTAGSLNGGTFSSGQGMRGTSSSFDSTAYALRLQFQLLQ